MTNIKINIKATKINKEGIELAGKLVKAKRELCLEYCPHPPHLTLNYLAKHFKDLEIIYYGTRCNIKLDNNLDNK